jgi:metal-responsive CopG/Arc/MetJ family transcriptional regulator
MMPVAVLMEKVDFIVDVEPWVLEILDELLATGKYKSRDEVVEEAIRELILLKTGCDPLRKKEKS